MIYKHQMDWFNYGKPIQAKSQFWSDYMRNIKGTVDSVAHLSPTLRRINRAQSLEREPRVHKYDYDTYRPWERDSTYSFPTNSSSGLSKPFDDSYLEYTPVKAPYREPWWMSDHNARTGFYPHQTMYRPIHKRIWGGYPVGSYGYRYP